MTAFLLLSLPCSTHALTDGSVTGGGGAGVDTSGDDTSVKSKVIKVKKIEVEDHKDRITIDETVELAVTVLPADATNGTATYKSSNKKVVTVSANGKVKGVGKGQATVTITAGKVTKKLKFVVIGAKTAAITLSKEYLVLTIGKSYKVAATVSPSNASHSLKYQSLNKKVATVSGSGKVTGVGVGSTSIIVSNEDMTVAVSVIINEKSAKKARGVGDAEGVSSSAVAGEIPDVGQDIASDKVVAKIRESASGILLSQEECPVITKPVLKELYDTDKSLTVVAYNYRLTVDGASIINLDNEIYTGIDFTNDGNGIAFMLNKGNNLPGVVQLEITDNSLKKQYLYLYNENKDKFEKLNVDNVGGADHAGGGTGDASDVSGNASGVGNGGDSGGDVGDVREGNGYRLDIAGKYLLSNSSLGMLGFNIAWFIIGGILIGIGIVIYIVIKKRYWFW